MRMRPAPLQGLYILEARAGRRGADSRSGDGKESSGEGDEGRGMGGGRRGKKAKRRKKGKSIKAAEE